MSKITLSSPQEGKDHWSRSLSPSPLTLAQPPFEQSPASLRWSCPVTDRSLSVFCVVVSSSSPFVEEGTGVPCGEATFAMTGSNGWVPDPNSKLTAILKGLD